MIQLQRDAHTPRRIDPSICESTYRFESIRATHTRSSQDARKLDHVTLPEAFLQTNTKVSKPTNSSKQCKSSKYQHTVERTNVFYSKLWYELLAPKSGGRKGPCSKPFSDRLHRLKNRIKLKLAQRCFHMKGQFLTIVTCRKARDSNRELHKLRHGISQFCDFVLKIPKNQNWRSAEQNITMDANIVERPTMTNTLRYTPSKHTLENFQDFGLGSRQDCPKK